MNIQWYPGHMMKAKRAMQEDIKLVDAVIELVDARAPMSSRNPDIDELGKGKYRIILLNKSDLADKAASKGFVDYFKERGMYVMEIDSRNTASAKKVNAIVREACREKLERDRQRGIKNRPVRAMVVGIPNVGKSTFINSFAGKACAKTGNRPGVTKGKQWIRLNRELELLDTPGILWPKFEDPDVGMKLACIGSINDDILQMQEMAGYMIRFLRAGYPGILEERYQIGGDVIEKMLADGRTPEEAVLFLVCESRNCYKKGNEPDYEKASSLLLDDFRSGRLGKISLEQKGDF